MSNVHTPPSHPVHTPPSHPVHTPPVVTQPTELNYADLPAYMVNPTTGNLVFGDGTTPNGGFEVFTSGTNSVNAPDQITLGLSDSYRTATPPNEPTSYHTNAHGISATYTVVDGTQSTANGSESNNPLRAADNFQYAVGDSTESLVNFIENGGSVTLTDTARSSTHTKGLTEVNLNLHLGIDAATPSGLAWFNQHNQAFITDDGSLASGKSIMNSENDVFFGNDTGPRVETISINAYEHNIHVAGIQMTIDHVA